MPRAGDRPLVIGVGQPHRGDDALGLAALERLAAAVPGDAVECRPHHGEGLGLMALWEGRSRVLVLDALEAGRPPGTLVRVTADDGPPRAGLFRSSSHAFGVGEAVALARVLGRLPASLTLLGLQGETWRLGAPLSPAVRDALPALVESACRMLPCPTIRDGTMMGP
ncbi:hydrogenase maturation protease [Roseospira visakhapatnamensis]|uniref:Hydrogenase maturation protease n=1 Tax=Roseospira visakhapatnamensis TaxID=390880 RepID=A0A7W6RAU4_9PROT|nr:hydrogenase maturation protease [Roseospira visakhapatnamensis]MBB4265104.1 hydrogenase maturation protease [Roseospira visakhapatnamensis]